MKLTTRAIRGFFMDADQHFERYYLWGSLVCCTELKDIAKMPA